VLQDATESVEEVEKKMEQNELELKMTMFGNGARTLVDLKNTNRVEVMGQSLLDEEIGIANCSLFRLQFFSVRTPIKMLGKCIFPLGSKSDMTKQAAI